MIVNPGTFQAIKRKQDDHTNKIFQEIEVVSQVKLFGKNIDNRLNFEQHINRICKSAANQLHALI